MSGKMYTLKEIVHEYGSEHDVDNGFYKYVNQYIVDPNLKIPEESKQSFENVISALHEEYESQGKGKSKHSTLRRLGKSVAAFLVGMGLGSAVVGGLNYFEGNGFDPIYFHEKSVGHMNGTAQINENGNFSTPGPINYTGQANGNLSEMNYTGSIQAYLQNATLNADLNAHLQNTTVNADLDSQLNATLNADLNAHLQNTTVNADLDSQLNATLNADLNAHLQNTTLDAKLEGTTINGTVDMYVVNATINGTYNGTIHYSNGDVPENGTINLSNYTGWLKGNFSGKISGTVKGNITGDVDGTVNGNVTGEMKGTVKGNITGDVDGTVNGNVTGEMKGTVKGNITGDVDGTVKGNITGELYGTESGYIHGGNISAYLSGTIEKMKMNGVLEGTANLEAMLTQEELLPIAAFYTTASALAALIAYGTGNKQEKFDCEKPIKNIIKEYINTLGKLNELLKSPNDNEIVTKLESLDKNYSSLLDLKKDLIEELNNLNRELSRDINGVVSLLNGAKGVTLSNPTLNQYNDKLQNIENELKSIKDTLYETNGLPKKETNSNIGDELTGTIGSETKSNKEEDLEENITESDLESIADVERDINKDSAMGDNVDVATKKDSESKNGDNNE